MFSVDATPWHREGTILREAPSLKEALELGGLDFNVDVRPLYLRAPTAPELRGVAEGTVVFEVPDRRWGLVLRLTIHGETADLRVDAVEGGR